MMKSTSGIFGFFKIILFFVFLLATTSPELVFAASDNDSAATSSPETDDVLSRIYKVAMHGDLSDVDFFSKTIGVDMRQLPDKKTIFAFEVCGIPEDPDLVDSLPAKLRRYQYFNAPWFLKKPVEHPNICSADYVERLDDQDRISKIAVRMEFDTSRACITELDIVKNMPGAKRDDKSTPNTFLYDYYGENNIKLTFVSSQRKSFPMCVGWLFLSK